MTIGPVRYGFKWEVWHVGRKGSALAGTKFEVLVGTGLGKLIDSELELARMELAGTESRVLAGMVAMSGSVMMYLKELKYVGGEIVKMRVKGLRPMDGSSRVADE